MVIGTDTPLELGTVTVIELSEIAVTAAGASPKYTKTFAPTVPKLEPVKVTEAPAAPDKVEIEVTVGVLVGEYVNLQFVLHVAWSVSLPYIIRS